LGKNVTASNNDSVLAKPVCLEMRKLAASRWPFFGCPNDCEKVRDIRHHSIIVHDLGSSGEGLLRPFVVPGIEGGEEAFDKHGCRLVSRQFLR
jgi:hypothetical protein